MRHGIPDDRRDVLTARPDGLSGDEAAQRRQRFGANDILAAPPSGWGAVLRDSARDPMPWFLVFAAALFAWLGDYVEAIVLTVALVPIFGMDAWLHRRTQASTEGLAGRLASRATVLRDGAWRELPAIDLVPGDTVLVRESQPFPADGVILAGDNLQVDASALTGESLPLRKRGLAEPAGQASIDDAHWGAAGTRLLTGEATVRVVLTGGETLYGEIVHSAQRGEHERTPLQRSVAALVAVLVVAATALCVALALTRYLQGHGIADALLSAVTLAVAALPEEFPVVLAVFLGVGVYRLARRKALVRRAVVVENIGRVTCICTDKTGTLTEGRLRLEHLLPAEGIDEGELLRAAALASREASADPMDIAVLALAAPNHDERVATFPFTEDRRREVGIARLPDGRHVAAAKGAPETILAMTSLDEDARAPWLERMLELAASGHKLIACARRPLSEWSGGEPDRGYEFLGLLAFEDPVRAGVAEAIAQAQAAGIRVIMLTGDHPATARAIAGELGIGGASPDVIEGDELAAIARRDGDDGLQALDVVARCLPAQKLELVRALKRSGETVAVTGDGVNDVPALQGADIGIAMGERGTRAAREVASIVLLDDDFGTLVRAIAEGRQLFDNLRLSFAYLLLVHIPLVLTAALIPFAGHPLLYLPIHIVWLELLIHPTALLVFQELPPAGRLARVRRHARLRFFDTRAWWLVGGGGALLTALVAWAYVRGAATDPEHARGMAIVALVFASAAITAGLSGLRTRAARTATLLTALSALAIAQIPALAKLLHLRPLHADDWLIPLLAAAVAVLVAVAIRHPETRKSHSGDQAHA